ncbi:MAG: hypothetical protein Q9191_008067, partial [Dirinaria sp. TL-2023a]
MSLQRCALSPPTFRFASSTLPPAVFHLPRAFHTFNRLHRASKRELQTATAYQPHSLDTIPPPPPRNAGIPDTSIAGTVPKVHETRPPPAPAAQAENQEPVVSIPEGEAQKPQPLAAAAAPPTAAPQEKQASNKRPKLRPRKAAMHLTPSAIRQLRTLLAQPDPKMIRVGVKNRGCSGLAYHLEYVEKAGMFDEAVEQDGVK